MGGADRPRRVGRCRLESLVGGGQAGTVETVEQRGGAGGGWPWRGGLWQRRTSRLELGRAKSRRILGAEGGEFVPGGIVTLARTHQQRLRLADRRYGDARARARGRRHGGGRRPGRDGGTEHRADGHRKRGQPSTGPGPPPYS